MLTKLMEGLGDRLADRWVATLLTPAFFFWLGGLVAWIGHFGWTSLEQWFIHQSQVVQIVLLIGALLIITLSALVIQQLELGIIRFLEGYWPRGLKRLRKWLIQRKVAQHERLHRRFQELASRGLDNLSTEERDEYVSLDWRLMHIPASTGRLMPTTLGNILRAAELRSTGKYGLDFVVCWPRLWLLLPADVKKELTDVRAVLNTGAHVFAWGILFLIWTIWAWWTIPVTLIVTFYAYRWMVNVAVIYSDLLDATFDLHRTALYKSLHWPLPTNPDMEREVGEQVTIYLWRGAEGPAPVFVTDES